MAHAEIMSTKILRIAGFLALLVCCYGQQQHPSCRIWKAMAEQLNNQPGKQMRCFANDTNPCTSLRCSGTYKYRSWLLPTEGGIEVDYCFGMRLNHCDNPVSMDVYLIVPENNPSHHNIRFFKRISHNTQVKIPGFSFRLRNIGTFDAYLYFHMVRNGSVVNLSITAKVRMAVNKMVMWPASMQKLIVPNEQIPVPPCSEHTSATPATMTFTGGCHPPTWRPPTPRPGVSTTTQSPFVTIPPKSLPTQPAITTPPASHTFNRKCSEGQPYCGLLEMCDISAGKCVCAPDFKFDKTRGSCTSQTRLHKPCNPLYPKCGLNEECRDKTCQCQKGYDFERWRQMCVMQSSGNLPTTPFPVVSPQPHVVTMANQPITAPPANKTAIIAGAVVGGVVFLVLLGLFVFFMVRRARRPYENREMLLSDDTDGIM